MNPGNTNNRQQRDDDQVVRIETACPAELERVVEACEAAIIHEVSHYEPDQAVLAALRARRAEALGHLMQKAA